MAPSPAAGTKATLRQVANTVKTEVKAARLFASEGALRRSPKGKLTHVEPELAAMVVRQYLLPMFERKVLVGAAPRKEDTPRSQPEEDAKTGLPQSQAVYEELMLSDRLFSELEKRKPLNAALHEQLDVSNSRRAKKHDEQLALDLELEKMKSECKLRELQEQTLQLRATRKDTQVSSLRKELAQLQHELKMQFKENQKLSERIAANEQRLGTLSVAMAQSQNFAASAQLENDVLAGQVRCLHSMSSSLQIMSQKPTVLQEQNAQYEAELAELHSRKEQVELELHAVVTDRLALERSCKELMNKRDQLFAEGQNLQALFERERERCKEEEIQIAVETDNTRKERDRLERKIQELSEDRDKLKSRLKKYRARRNLFQIDQKSCRCCGKDYLESENFNWSCRTHQSEFGGEMWWCCGKFGKEAPGCKYAKHESKEDDDDDLDADEMVERQEERDRQKKLKTQNITCFACSEVGHSAKDCPQDPNVRLADAYTATREHRRVLQLANSAGRRGRKADIATLKEKLTEQWAMTEETTKDINPFDELIDRMKEEFNAEEEARRALLDMQGTLQERTTSRRPAFTAPQTGLDLELAPPDETSSEYSHSEDEDESPSETDDSESRHSDSDEHVHMDEPVIGV